MNNMNFHLTKKSFEPKHKKDGRINPHRFWIFFVTIFILVLTVEIVFFSYFFVVSSNKLDIQVTPKLDTNSGQINKIENIIIKTEEAVSSRTK